MTILMRETKIVPQEEIYSESERSSEESDDASNAGEPHG
jgi:hypothetical protein